MNGIDTGKIKNAAIVMAALDSSAKNAALANIARQLVDNKQRIDEVNMLDVERATSAGLPAPIIKRLRMDAGKVDSVAAGIHSLISLEDPVGRQLFATELSDGLVLRKVSCPIGVIGVIFESRPDALVQIACLCLKSGNAVILKGGSEASETNRLLTELIKEATIAGDAGDIGGDAAGSTDGGAAVGKDRDAAVGRGGVAAMNTGEANTGNVLPEAWVNQLETRAEIREILKMDGDIDLLIPRGSNEFVKYIMDNTRIPVLGHADGICHCYVDAAADIGMAVKVVTDSKTQYAAVCNATETLLVHRDIASVFLPALWDHMNGNGSSGIGGGESGDAAANAIPKSEKPYVQFKGCTETLQILKGRPVEAATDDDWGAEYLDYILAVKVVGSAVEAIDHINTYGSKHSDAIITNDANAARAFMSYVDSANIFHNCSTRFSDGFRYGFGAEVGVSTSKIHARGPVGLDGLSTYKFILSGNGDIVADFEQGTRTFTHKPLR